MPIYEHKCDSCDLILESFLKEKKDIIKCDVCGGEAKLQMSTVNFKIARKPIEHIQNGDVDRFVGQDAEKRWAEHDDRKKAKTKVLKENVKKAEKEIIFKLSTLQ